MNMAKNDKKALLKASKVLFQAFPTRTLNFVTICFSRTRFIEYIYDNVLYFYLHPPNSSSPSSRATPLASSSCEIPEKLGI